MPSDLTFLNTLQAIAFDVDGVLTDGTVTWNSAETMAEAEFPGKGHTGITDAMPAERMPAELKTFAFSDIMGISLARRLGIKLALISGEPSSLVDRYAAKLRIPHVVKGCRDKASALREWSSLTGVPLAEICFFGDDVNDLWAMEIAGSCACPANAAAEVRRYVETHTQGFVAPERGGDGAVRTFIDAILLARNLEGKHVFRLRPPE